MMKQIEEGNLGEEGGGSVSMHNRWPRGIISELGAVSEESGDGSLCQG